MRARGERNERQEECGRNAVRTRAELGRNSGTLIASSPLFCLAAPSKRILLFLYEGLVPQVSLDLSFPVIVCDLSEKSAIHAFFTRAQLGRPAVDPRVTRGL
jgi:hypothetical protein